MSDVALILSLTAIPCAGGRDLHANFIAVSVLHAACRASWHGVQQRRLPYQLVGDSDQAWLGC